MTKPKLADPRASLIIKLEPSDDMTAKEWELIKRRCEEAVKQVIRDAGRDVVPGDDP